MGDWLFQLLVIGFVIWLTWHFLQTHYTFVIQINDGWPTVNKGEVPDVFLNQVAEVCQDVGVLQGWIGGVQKGRRISLRFSKQFPPGPKQRLRNAWAMIH